MKYKQAAVFTRCLRTTVNWVKSPLTHDTALELCAEYGIPSAVMASCVADASEVKCVSERATPTEQRIRLIDVVLISYACFAYTRIETLAHFCIENEN